MRVIKARKIPVEKLPSTDVKTQEVMSRKEVLSDMKYAKIIQASSRKNIMEPYVPEDTPPVVDEDLPEPTNEESDTEVQVTADEILTPEDQEFIDSIDKKKISKALSSRYNNNDPLDLNELDIDNNEVLGQIPRGTPVEPMADPGKPDEIENTWTHKTLQSILSAENALTTDSGDASKGSDDSKLASYKYNCLDLCRRIFIKNITYSIQKYSLA